MKKHRAILLLSLALLANTPHGGNGPDGIPSKPAATVSPANLWQKALDIYRKNHDWYPGRITILSEVLNRHGQPYSVTQLFFIINMSADGRLRAELARSLKNGKDTTRELKSKVTIYDLEEGMDPKTEDTYSVSISDSPFDPLHQGVVTVHPGDERQMLFGHSCLRFAFSYQTEIVRKGEKEKLTWKGAAWLEETSGVPIKLEFSIEPLPRRIRSLWTIYTYDTASPKKWVVKKINISGQGGFLFIKKRFRSTTTFGDYRRIPRRRGKHE